MIRIQATINPGGITLAIDGQLIGEYVAEIEASIRQSMEQYKTVDLFLRNVSHIDEAGHALLSRLAAQRVKLRAAGLYSSHVVTQVQLALSSRKAGESDTQAPDQHSFRHRVRRLTSALAEVGPERPLSR